MKYNKKSKYQWNSWQFCCRSTVPIWQHNMSMPIQDEFNLNADSTAVTVKNRSKSIRAPDNLMESSLDCISTSRLFPWRIKTFETFYKLQTHTVCMRGRRGGDKNFTTRKPHGYCIFHFQLLYPLLNDQQHLKSCCGLTGTGADKSPGLKDYKNSSVWN